MAERLDDLAAVLAVLQARSFTKAAATLGLSQSVLSQRVRLFEARLGVRLLTRTTRRVTPTEAGDALLRRIEPRLSGIASELDAIRAMAGRIAGTLRIAATENAARMVLLPALPALLDAHPQLRIEIVIEYGLTDLVAGRFDAGIRPQENLAPGMISVPVAPPMRMAVVASPAYFRRHPPPATPQALLAHNCINLRLPTHGGLYRWEFERDGHEVQVRVEGQLVCGTAALLREAALAGLGVAYLMAHYVEPDLAAGRLERALEDWCPPFPGYHLYYPDRRQASPAFRLLVDALRLRSG